MKVRILFLITQDLQSPSGLGRYLPLAAGLVRNGFEVRIAALHSNFEALEHHFQKIDGVPVQYVAPMHVKKQGNVKTYYPPLKLISLTLYATWQLTRSVLGSPFDIVHVCKPQPMNGIAGLIGKLIRPRLLYIDCDDYEAASNRFFGSWQQSVVKIAEDNLPRHADLVTSNTYFTLDRLRKNGLSEDRLVYLPNGVDRSRFSQPSCERVETLRMRLHLTGHRVVIYVGSLSLPSHPVDLLIQSFALLHAQFSDMRLLIVGGGEDLPILQNQVSALGLKDVVIFTGRIPANEVPLYYLLGNVSVDPVYNTPAAAGRAPLKMFESWASGVPFVTQDVGDRRRLAGDPPAAALARPGSPESLSNVIEQVLSQPMLASLLRERGFQEVQNYYWDRIVEKTAWIYRRGIEE